MDFLLLPSAVTGFVFGAAVGWGVSMLVWGGRATCTNDHDFDNYLFGCRRTCI